MSLHTHQCYCMPCLKASQSVMSKQACSDHPPIMTIILLKDGKVNLVVNPGPVHISVSHLRSVWPRSLKMTKAQKDHKKHS